MARHFALIISVLLFIILSIPGLSLAQCLEGDCLNGTGTVQLPSGSRYTGGFRNGLFEGHGVMYFYNGSRYEGMWKQGAMEGEGTWYYSNGMTMKSSFRMDGSEGDVVMKGKAPESRELRLARLVPADTELLFVMRSPDAFFRYLPLNRENFGGKPMDHDMIRQITDSVGFNPLSRDELLASGFDPDRETGVALSGMEMTAENNFSVNILFCLPVLDGDLALQRIKGAMRKSSKNQMTFQLEEEGVIRVNGLSGGKTMCIAARKRYLLVAFNPGGDSLPRLKETLGGESSLASSAIYREVASRLNTGEEFFLYMDGRKIFDFYSLMLSRSLMGSGQEMAFLGAMNSLSQEMIKDYRGLGMTIDCDSRDFIVKSVFNVEKGASMLRVYGDIAWDKQPLMGHPENPLFLLSVGFNMKEYYSLLSQSLSPLIHAFIEGQLSQLKENYGIDIKKEIIDNMAGTVNAGLYDGASVSAGKLNVFFTFNVKRSDVLDSVLKRIPAAASVDTVQNVKVGKYKALRIKTGFDYLYVAVKGKNCFMAFSPEILTMAMEGNWSKSFLKGMKDKKLAGKLRGNESVIYLDGPELRKAIANFLSGNPQKAKQVDDIMAWYRYLFINYYVRESSICSDFEIRTGFEGPFFNGLAGSLREAFKD
jgi:hypothetical protein